MDCCKLEFTYGLRKKKQTRMIPIILERRMNDPSEWNGALGMALGGDLSIRMSFDFNAEPQKFRDGLNMIKSEINNRLGLKEPEPEPEVAPAPAQPGIFCLVHSYTAPI